MQRCFYRAVLSKNGEAPNGLLQTDATTLARRLRDEDLLTLSLYRWEAQLFLYYECKGEMQPQEALPSLSPLLQSWPDMKSHARVWAQMMPVYLAARPDGASAWRDGHVPAKRRGMLLRLKPEMVASYVYWHYQRQEEAREVPNKYLAVALHENLLFYYDELPPVSAPYRGTLPTRHTPADWDAVMEPHFLYWEGVQPDQKRKRPLECLLSL